MILLGEYLVMLKKFVLVYKMGKFGCVVLDIINVCWNVDSVFLRLCDIFGRLEGLLFFIFDVLEVCDVGMVGSVIEVCFIFLLLFDWWFLFDCCVMIFCVLFVLLLDFNISFYFVVCFFIVFLGMVFFFGDFVLLFCSFFVVLDCFFVFVLV